MRIRYGHLRIPITRRHHAVHVAIANLVNSPYHSTVDQALSNLLGIDNGDDDDGEKEKKPYFWKMFSKIRF